MLCGFVGFANLNKDLSKNIHIIKNMVLQTKKKNLVKEDYFINTNINIGYTTNEEKDKKLLSLKYNNTIYTLVLNGQIYNKCEIKNELQEFGYEFKRIFR